MFMIDNLDEESLKKAKRRYYFAGALMLIIGTLSVAMPLLASFAIETVMGCLLIGVAVCEGAASVRGFKDGATPWPQTFMAVMSFIAGAVFLLRPMAGVMTLSFILSMYFFIDGVTKVIDYFRLRVIGGSVWILASGAISIILAFLMWKNFFAGAAVIGVILGIDLTFSGICFILLGRGCSKGAENLHSLN